MFPVKNKLESEAEQPDRYPTAAGFPIDKKLEVVEAKKRFFFSPGVERVNLKVHSYTFWRKLRFAPRAA